MKSKTKIRFEVRYQYYKGDGWFNNKLVKPKRALLKWIRDAKSYRLIRRVQLFEVRTSERRVIIK